MKTSWGWSCIAGRLGTMVNIHIWESKNKLPRRANELSGKERLQVPVATQAVVF